MKEINIVLGAGLISILTWLSDIPYCKRSFGTSINLCNCLLVYNVCLGHGSFELPFEFEAGF